MATPTIVTVRPTDPVDTLQQLPAYVGVSAETAGATAIGMNLVVIPPGGRAEAHYHDGFETAIFLLSGRVETRYGAGLSETCVNEAGDFLHIPAGVPHLTAQSLQGRNRAIRRSVAASSTFGDRPCLSGRRPLGPQGSRSPGDGEDLAGSRSLTSPLLWWLIASPSMCISEAFDEERN
jgi:uncharacterized RmlC-like cupin family protein